MKRVLVVAALVAAITQPCQRFRNIFKKYRDASLLRL